MAQSEWPGWGPVLPAQHGMILNYMRFPDDGVDVIQVTLDWTGPLEREPFEAAWRGAARQHPVLRTAFRLDDRDGLVQVVDPEASIDIRWRDLPQPPASGPDHPFESFLRADRRERLNLTRGPLVRLTILRRVGPADEGSGYVPAHRAVLTFHHALLDGRSLRLLVDDVSAAYAASRDGRAAPDQMRPPFHEFVRWWHMTDPSASEQFWTDYLAETVLPRPLPGYLGAPVAGTAEPMTAETVLSRTDSELIREAASTAGLSSSTVVSAAWALLRARYGGVSDIVLAVTRSCRRDSIPGADAIIGLLINTVPLRVRIDEDWSVRELLTAVSEGIRRIRAHQRTPMGSALTWAGLPADTTLVDSLVMFDRRRLQTGLLGGDAAPSSARLDRLPSYPVTLCAFDEPQMHLSLIWDRRRFADGSVQRILDQLRATLIEFASRPSAPLADLDLGRAAEAGIVAGWNRTRSAYPSEATIPALFAAQVARDPDATARGLRRRLRDLRRARPAQQRTGLAAAPPWRGRGYAGRGGDRAWPRSRRGAPGRAEGRRRLPADRHRQPALTRGRHDRCRGGPARPGHGRDLRFHSRAGGRGLAARRPGNRWHRAGAGRGRARGTARRVASAVPGLRQLHLRLDGRAEGRRRTAAGRHPARQRPDVRLARPRRAAAPPGPGRVRCFHARDLGRTADRWHGRGRAARPARAVGGRRRCCVPPT